MLSVREIRFGAKGDGRADDTAALQAAIDAVSGSGGTVRVPKGTYLVDALVSVRLKSRMTLRLEPGAVLKALPNASAHSAVLLVAGAEDAKVQGGTILGERDAHTGQGGEWGHGLVVKDSRRIAVEGVTAVACWGDGFYVSGSADVFLSRVTADRNRRQGLSITSVKGMVVEDSTFRNTGGTLPEDGLDIEPNPGETVEGVRILRCRFQDNGGFGVEVGVPLSYAGRAWIRGVTVEDCTILGSGRGTLSRSPRAGLEASNTTGHRFVRNTLRGNGLGILLRNGADRFEVRDNLVEANLGDGIVQYLCKDNTLAGNRVFRNRGHGIDSPSSSGAKLENNEVAGNGQVP